MQGLRGWLEGCCVLLISGLFALSLIQTHVLRDADNIIHDVLLSFGRHRPDDRILVVAIDNRSLEALGRWPWPRDTHARLLDRLTDQGAAAVGFDVLFTEPSGPADAVLASALTRSGRACLPMAVDHTGRNGADWDELLPLPQLAAAAAGTGQVNLAADSDGIVRQGFLSVHAQTRSWDHLVTCVLRVSGLMTEALPSAAPTPPGSGLGVTAIGINFPGEQGVFRTISYIDLLNGEAPPDLIAGRLVLVGMTADGQGDRYAVAAPRGRLVPGVEIQAALTDTLLAGTAIRIVPDWVVMGLALSLLTLLMLVFLRLSPRWGLVATLGLSLGVLALSAALFSLHLWLPPLGVIVGLAIAFPLWSWRRLATTSAWLDRELQGFVADAASDTQVSKPPSQDVVSRQVAALHQAVARLRGMNRFISDTLESLPDAAVVVDAEGLILYANQRARTLFETGGHPQENPATSALTGTRLADRLNALHPDLDALIEAGIEVRLTDGRALRLDSAALADGDGQRRIIRLADVTLLRATERQRDEALQLLGHDMRAPQTAILTLVEGDVDRTDPRLLTRIADYARMTLKLADGYVQLARAEAGPLHKDRLDLREIVIDAIDILWPVSKARQIAIILADTPDIEVEGDRSLLTRAVMNLLDNGLKHSPAGAAVTVDIAAVTGNAHIRIADAGSGLTPADFQRFMKPFEHGQDRTAGAGLGLAFVARVAARHGGDLILEPPTGGTRLILSIPLA